MSAYSAATNATSTVQHAILSSINVTDTEDSETQLLAAPLVTEDSGKRKRDDRDLEDFAPPAKKLHIKDEDSAPPTKKQQVVVKEEQLDGEQNDAMTTSKEELGTVHEFECSDGKVLVSRQELAELCNDSHIDRLMELLNANPGLFAKYDITRRELNDIRQCVAAAKRCEFASITEVDACDMKHAAMRLGGFRSVEAHSGGIVSIPGGRKNTEAYEWKTVGPLDSSAKINYDRRAQALAEEGYEWAYMQPVKGTGTCLVMHFFRKK